MLRFVLVHDADRQGSRNHIGRLQHPNLELLSTHGTGFELLRRTSLPKANAIVLNGDLPDLPQHLFLRHACERFPHVPLLVADERRDGDLIHRALVHGASGYLRTPCTGDDLAAAVRTIVRSSIALGPEELRRLIDHLRHKKAPVHFGLTAKERLVIGLLAEGHTYAQVAERLHLSAFTVKNHTHRIIKKMKAPNRVAAINRFMNRG